MNKKKLIIDIIKANQKHLPEILLIAQKQLGYTHFLKNYLLDNKSLIYCALYNKEVLGYVVGKVFRNDAFFRNYKKLNTIKTNELEKAKSIGMLVSIAVKKEHQHKGISTNLVTEMLKKFIELNADIVLMTAWKSKSGINMQKIAACFGFKTCAEIENYWKEDSQKHNYQCPHCGAPPCRCACVVYILKF